MAIRLDHGPIGLAGQLAYTAGRGDEFRWRFGAEQQLVNQAMQRQQLARSGRAQDIQLAMAQRDQDFRHRQAAQSAAMQRTHARGAAAADARRQKLDEERFQFEREKFAAQQPQREAESQARLERERRLGAGQVQDPTQAPAFKALDAMLAPYERQAQKIQDEIRKAESGVSFADPRMLNAQLQQIQAIPIQMPDGSQATVGDLFNLKDSYLAQALPMFQAAQQAEQAAQEKALTEARIDETVDELSQRLDPGTPTPQIAQQVINKLGPASTPEEAMVIAEAVNEIEQNIRRNAGHMFPNITGGP